MSVVEGESLCPVVSVSGLQTHGGEEGFVCLLGRCRRQLVFFLAVSGPFVERPFDGPNVAYGAQDLWGIQGPFVRGTQWEGPGCKRGPDPPPEPGPFLPTGLRGRGTGPPVHVCVSGEPATFRRGLP